MNDKEEKKIGEYRFMKIFKQKMIDTQIRYKELLILVGHCNIEDKEHFEQLFKKNIESNHSQMNFLINPYQDEIGIKTLELMKKEIANQPMSEHPDLNFVNNYKLNKVRQIKMKNELWNDIPDCMLFDDDVYQMDIEDLDNEVLY